MGVLLLDTGTWLAPGPRPGSEKNDRENHSRERGVLNRDKRERRSKGSVELAQRGSRSSNDRAQNKTGSVGPLPPCS